LRSKLTLHTSRVTVNGLHAVGQITADHVTSGAD